MEALLLLFCLVEFWQDSHPIETKAHENMGKRCSNKDMYMFLVQVVHRFDKCHIDEHSSHYLPHISKFSKLINHAARVISC